MPGMPGWQEIPVYAAQPLLVLGVRLGLVLGVRLRLVLRVRLDLVLRVGLSGCHYRPLRM